MKMLTSMMFVVALALAPAAEASEALKAVVDSYLQIQTRLAGDKVEGLKAPAAAIAARAGELGAAGAPIAAAAKKLEAATDLKSARDAFAPLSEAVIAAAQAENFDGLPGVKVAYCSMVNASWLQKDERIRNPYYGSGMLECGEFKR